MRKRSGQILILVLLVVVVALALGLSVASRNITNLRTSTQTEQSQRAFSAAEGGVEDVLSRLNDVSGVITGAGSSPGCNLFGGIAKCDVGVGELTAKVDVKDSNVYPKISEGNVGQFDLAGATYPATLTIEWAKNSDPAEADKPASIEVTQVYGTSPNYNQERNAYSGGPFPERDEAGFTPGSCVFAADEYKCRVTILLQSNPVLLRVRPFWASTTVKLTSTGALPIQAYDITSTATTDLGITRRVQVQRTALPQLPASFDYVLFSDLSIVK